MVTDDNAYVEYKDQAYEVGTKAVQRSCAPADGVPGAGAAGRRRSGHVPGAVLERRSSRRAATPSACDIDFESWLTNLTNDGTEDVGGTVDGPRLGRRRRDDRCSPTSAASRASIPGADAQGIDPSQLGAVSGAVTDASFDVYSGEDDHVLRKLDANLTIDPIADRSRGRDLGLEHPDLSSRSRSTASTRTRRSRLRPTRSRSASCSATSGLDPSALGGLGGASLGGGSSGGRWRAAARSSSASSRRSTPDEINACASSARRLSSGQAACERAPGRMRSGARRSF